MKLFNLTRRSRQQNSESGLSGSQIRLGNDEELIFEFTDQFGNSLGVKLKGESGKLELGGWDSTGGWVSLVPMTPCTHAGCQYPDNHTSPFPLNQRGRGIQ